jgi:hypothetical protein
MNYPKNQATTNVQTMSPHVSPSRMCTNLSAKLCAMGYVYKTLAQKNVVT